MTPVLLDDYFRSRRVLVIGASGFLGNWLTHRLAGLGAQVFAASRHIEPDPDAPGIRAMRADASRATDVDRLFAESQPSVVFQLTSDSQGGRALELVRTSLSNDVLATVNVLCAAAATPRVERLVMTASLEEPSGVGGEPVPVSPYAAAKWATGGYGRMFRALYGLDVRLARPFMTYGPGQKAYKLVPSVVLALLQGRVAEVRSAARAVDWIYVDDVIEGLLETAAAAQLDSTVDLGSGELVAVGQVVGEIARQIGRPELLRLGESVRGEEIVRAAQVDVAASQIGFRARTPLAEGLSRTIAWFRDR